MVLVDIGDQRAHSNLDAELLELSLRALREVWAIGGQDSFSAFEQDDLEVWEGCSRTLGGEQRGGFELCYAQLENEPLADSQFPGEVYAPPSDRPLLGFYRTWAGYMA